MKPLQKILCLGSLLAVIGTYMTPVYAASDAQLLSDKLSRMSALSGLFAQTTYSETDELISQASGEFHLQVPSKLNWQTFEPFPQSLISNGKTLWLYDPDLEQVTVSQITTQLESTPAIIFSGDFALLEEKYNVLQFSENVFQLTPIIDNGLFKSILIGFENDQLISLEMHDQMAQKTHYIFSETSDKTIEDSGLFSFVAPEGVDILIND